MANVAQAQGFLPLTPNARENGYTIASGYGTTINFGDPVAGSGTGTTLGNGSSYPGIVIGATGTAICGVFIGCTYTDSSGQLTFSKSWPASTTATNIIATVIDDPMCEFAIEYSNTTPMAVTDYWNSAAFVAGSGSNGISGYQLDSTTVGSGTDLQIRRLYNAPNNATGTNAVVVVGLRLHTLNYPYTAI